MSIEQNFGFKNYNPCFHNMELLKNEKQKVLLPLLTLRIQQNHYFFKKQMIILKN